MKKSLTIIIGAYDEESNIKAAINSVVNSMSGLVRDYEILVVDDGSKDSTSAVVKKIAANNHHIRLLQNSTNLGLGVSFRNALKVATKNYVTVFPGDNDMAGSSLRELVLRLDQADLITAYMINPHHRSFARRILSRLFVLFVNTLFNVHLKYYNGPFISKLSLIQKLPLKTTGLTIFAEMKIRLLKSGAQYEEIPFEHQGRKHERSKAISMKSIISTLNTLIILIRDYK